MLKDIEKLGAWAFLIDLIVFIALYHVIKPHYRKWKGITEDASEDEPLDNKTDN